MFIDVAADLGASGPTLRQIVRFRTEFNSGKIYFFTRSRDFPLDGVGNFPLG